MRIYISGGCKNGKSYYAQRIAKAQQNMGKLYYIATMLPADGEDGERIERHKQEREGWGFKTIERQEKINGLADECEPDGSFLLDSVTALLANEMFPLSGKVRKNAGETVAADLCSFLSRIENIVLVSDYIFSDAMLYDPLTERYREQLAYTDRVVTGICDVLLEVSFSAVIIHKGAEVFLRIEREILNDTDFRRSLSGQA